MASAQPTGIARTPTMPVAVLRYQQFAGRFPDFMADVRLAGRDVRAALARLAALEGAAQRVRRERTRTLLHDRRLLLPYLVTALNRTGRLARATPDSVTAMLERINLFAPCHEPTRMHPVAHGSRQRLVQSFGPIKRAQQRFTADVIRALHPPRPNQSLFGGGIPAALRAVEAACARGLSHAVELDVRDFYGSVPRERLAGLLWPLPKAVVDHVVWDETLRVTGDDNSGVITVARATPPLNALVGLSVGAASSPVVGEVVIGSLLADPDIDFDADIITYADNLLVLGRSEAEAMSRADHLATVAARPVHGALRLRERARGHCLQVGTSLGGAFSQGIVFVGQIGEPLDDGGFSWEPEPLKRDQHRLANRDMLPSLEDIAAAEAKVAAFHRAYPLWRGRDAREAHVRAELACARFFHQPASVEAMSLAARCLILACLLNGGSQGLDELIPEVGGTRVQAARGRLIREVERLWSEIMAAQPVAEHVG